MQKIFQPSLVLRKKFSGAGGGSSFGSPLAASVFGTVAGFVGAVAEALSGLEPVTVTGEDINQALLAGGSPATPEELRKRFETFINDRCKGKDAGKLRFVVE